MLTSMSELPLKTASDSVKKPKSKKKYVIIAGIALLVPAITVGTLVLTKNDDKALTSTTNNNSVTADKDDSDYVGNTDSCKPLDDNQWYRTNKTLSVDYTNDQIVNVFVEKRGFFRTEDGGKTWKYLSKGIKGFNAPDNDKGRPCYLEFKSTAMDPTNPQRILIGALGDFGTITSNFNQAGGMLETTDGGKTWKQVLTDGVVGYVHDIAIDPTDPKTIYYVTSPLKPVGQDKSLLTKGLAYKTIDGGKSWQELPTGLYGGSTAQEIFIDSKNPKRLVITTATFTQGPNGRMPGGEGLGTLVSEDGGVTWKSFDTLPDGETSLNSYASMSNLNNLYISVMSDSGAKSYYSKDMGKTFTKSGLPMDVVTYDESDPAGNTLIGYGWQTGLKSIFKSTNGGATWTPIGTIPSDITNIQDPKQRISKIVISKTDSKTIYMSGSSANVWKSVDSGGTWQTILSLTTLP